MRLERERAKIFCVAMLAILTCVFLTIDAQSTVSISTEPLTTVFVYPFNITDPTLTPPKEFTIEVKMWNVTNLYGIDIQMSWNASLLNYTSHTVKIPVEKYPDGVLHEPGLLIKDEVDEEAGKYWLGYSSMLPAEAFNGSGTVFNMTFRVIGFGKCHLDIYSSSLADMDGIPIEHKAEDGYFDNTFYDVAIIEVEPSTASASPGQTMNIFVTVKNNGTVRDETFNVSTYWGGFLIETKPVVGLSPGVEETLNVTWVIPPELDGYEMIWANVTIVLRDANVENNRFEDGMLAITVGVHDVAVKAVTIPKNAIGQGQSMNITVLVSNQGSFPETVNVTVYLGDTVTGERVVILDPDSDNEIIVLLTGDMPLYINYTLTAKVSPVPGETDIEDNTFIDGVIMITIPGDVDGDKDVDLYDVVKICSVYGSKKGDPEYDADCDVNGDDKIDLYDVVIACARYGEKV